jgi:hypothetical protein
MKRLFLVAVALGGLAALATSGANAAPLAAGIHAAPTQPVVTQVDYYWHRHYWRHRHWYRHHWHYWR